MPEVGIGLPGQSIEDVREAAAAADGYGFDSFTVYGDLGDLPPYAVLHASADLLKGSDIPYIGPIGTPVGMQHPEVIATHARALEQQLPGQSSIGLVRGAFMEQIGAKPASLAQLEATVSHIRQHFDPEVTPPIFLGGFGPKLLQMAGRLGVYGVKLGGSTNPALAGRARELIGNPDVKIVLGAVSIIDPDRKLARAAAREEVAKYLAVVGHLDPTLDGDEQDSLKQFNARFATGDPRAGDAISDALLDKFAMTGTPDDALDMLEGMSGTVDRFEFGTPHGLGKRANAIRYIGSTIAVAIRQ